MASELEGSIQKPPGSSQERAQPLGSVGSSQQVFCWQNWLLLFERGMRIAAVGSSAVVTWGGGSQSQGLSPQDEEYQGADSVHRLPAKPFLPCRRNA